MKKYLLMILLPVLIFLSYLVSVNHQAAFMFVGLLVFFIWLIYLATKIRNNVLIAAISLAAIANVIGTPLFILNKEKYSYDGWNAVKDFDFSTISFLNIYAYSFTSILLLVGFVWIIEKYNPEHLSVYFKNNENEISRNILDSNINKKKKSKFTWSFVFFIFYIITVAIAVFMYINKIGILGIEPERLPFKMVGILFYLRGYILPITLFVIFNKTSKSILLMVLVIILAIMMGALSASRGITFIYMFPVIVGILNKKVSFQRVALVAALIVLSYVVTSMARDIIYANAEQSLSIIDLLLGLLGSSSEFQSDRGLFFSLLNVISTISNRLYGAQDMVLAYQYVLIDPWSSFGNFLLTEPIADLAKELYGLEFSPGQGYGVGMGLLGIFVMIGRADVLLLVAAILFFSLLAVLINRLLTHLFILKQTEKFYQLYYLILFIVAFNFIQSTPSYLYFTILFSYILNKIKRLSNRYLIRQ